MLLASAKGGLGELRVHPVYVSSAAAAAAAAVVAGGRRRILLCLQPRHFVSSSALRNAAEAGAPSPSPEAAAAAKAAKKTGRAFYWFVGVAAATVIGSLAYPLVITIPPTPPAPPPHPPAPEQTQKSSSFMTPATPPQPYESLPPAAIPGMVPPLSPRNELTRRVETLKAELEDLRKEKRSQLVDMKKRAIKDEIAMIVSGLKKLDKS